MCYNLRGAAIFFWGGGTSSPQNQAFRNTWSRISDAPHVYITVVCREIFRVLDVMKMDMANFTIQQIRPLIQSQSVEYERKKFDDFLKVQEGEKQSKIPTGWWYQKPPPPPICPQWSTFFTSVTGLSGLPQSNWARFYIHRIPVKWHVRQIDCVLCQSRPTWCVLQNILIYLGNLLNLLL